MALVKLVLDMQLAKDDYMQKQIKVTQSSMPSLDEYIEEIKDNLYFPVLFFSN